MYGSNRIRAPHVPNYEYALNLHGEILPIRGRSDDVRPIAARRDDDRTIRRNPDNSVALRHHRTDVVTFMPDKKTVILNLGGHVSPTTIHYLNDTIGFGFLQHDNKVWIYARQSESQPRGYYPMPTTGITTLVRGSDGKLLLPNPQYPVVHNINRKQTNNVRSKYRAFVEYVERMLKLRGGNINVNEYLAEGRRLDWASSGRSSGLPRQLVVRAWGKPTSTELDELFGFVLSDDPASMNRALLWVSLASLNYVGDTGQKNVHLKDVLSSFDTLVLLRHARDCFSERVITDGRLAKDRYEAFFA